jgi:hypothetical protein
MRVAVTETVMRDVTVAEALAGEVLALAWSAARAGARPGGGGGAGPA